MKGIRVASVGPLSQERATRHVHSFIKQEATLDRTKSPHVSAVAKQLPLHSRVEARNPKRTIQIYTI